MFRAGTAKRWTVQALVTGGDTTAVLLGATGIASAATTFVEYGYGSSPSAAGSNLGANANAACTNGFDSTLPGAWWTGNEYEASSDITC